jgi:hypothetical protein
VAWFRVDDQFAEHSKVLDVRAKAGWAPVGLWLGAGTWANRNLSDGFVPRSWVTLNDGLEHAEVLVEVGLWLEDGARDGWTFKDYSEYQPSRADVEEKRAKVSAARSAAGKKSAAARQQTGNKRGTNAEQVVNPVPDPDPVLTSKEVRSRRAPSASAQRLERSRQRLGLVPDGGSAA